MNTPQYLKLVRSGHSLGHCETHFLFIKTILLLGYMLYKLLYILLSIILMFQFSCKTPQMVINCPEKNRFIVNTTLHTFNDFKLKAEMI